MSAHQTRPITERERTLLNILNLPGWHDLDVQEHDHLYEITVQVVNRIETCPLCGASVQQFGTRPRTFFDLPIHGKQVQLLARRRRYRCKNTEQKHTFLDPLPGMDEHYAATRRCIQYIEHQALSFDRSFASLARDLGVSESYIRKVVNASLPARERQYVLTAPTALGMDEIKVDGMCAVFTDLTERRLIDMLAKRDGETVKAWLLHLPERERVQVVVMDMWRPYKIAIQDILPQARIVIDKFHILRMVNEVVEHVRKATREELPFAQRKMLKHDRKLLLKREKDLTEQQRLIVESWTGIAPRLHDAYVLKEAFFAIWDATSEQDALDRYVLWQAHIPSPLQESFLSLQLTMETWGQEIFAYFALPQALTNAYTESNNRAIRDAHRLGRGYSFRVLRAKMLFGKRQSPSPDAGFPTRRRQRLQPQSAKEGQEV